MLAVLAYGLSVSEVAVKVGVSRQTLHGWLWSCLVLPHMFVVADGAEPPLGSWHSAPPV